MENNNCSYVRPMQERCMCYCSKSVFYCFKKLGFNNKLITKTITKLIKSSMVCSFHIWLARIIKSGLLLLPTISSMTLQKQFAIHHLLCHLLSTSPGQCQIQSQFDLLVSSTRVILVMPIPSSRFYVSKDLLNILYDSELRICKLNLFDSLII